MSEEHMNTQEENVQEGQKEEVTHTENGGGPRFLFWVIISAVIILAIAWIRPDGPIEPASEGDEQEEMTEEGEDGEESEEETEEGSAEELSYTPVADWELADRAEGAINQYLGSGQVIMDGVVADPEDENIVYFASATDKGDENMVAVYSYRLDNYNFERVFRATYAAGDMRSLGEEAVPNLHVIGYDEGNLILLAADRASEMESCDHPLLLGAEASDSYALLRMDLEDPYNSLESYEPTEEALEAAKEAMEGCEE